MLRSRRGPRRMTRRRNVLFLCTGNSARSILAEALLNLDGTGRFRAFSAGSHPKGEPHPMALDVLAEHGLPVLGLRSKPWEEFSEPGAPRMDLVITVCDSAAGETCPIWPGHPTTAHWGIEDPATVEGEGQRQAFLNAMSFLRNRISLLLALPEDQLDELQWGERVREIGRLDNGGRGGG
jgi:arsenate reductase